VQRGALLAGSRREVGPSLSPASLLLLEAGTRLVLPSPNGSTCCALAAAGGATVAVGSLRDRRAVAAWLQRVRGNGPVGVIAAGERWPSGALRPALEDLLGSGSILSLLEPDGQSPEARVAVAAFAGVAADLGGLIRESGSGRELLERGFEADVRLAVELDTTGRVPVLRDGVFVADDGATDAGRD
jgi:2-phosphosulfolactate phosphatase